MDSSDTKQKVIAQIVCILLAIGMWFYVVNIENPIKSQTINNVAIQINNRDDLEKFNLILVPDQEFYIDLKIEGTAQALRGISNEDFNIEVDINEYALKVGDNKLPVQVTNFPKDITVENTDILMVEVEIEEFIEKSVEIISAIEIEGKPGYYVSNPILEETEITISGAKSLVDKIEIVEARGTEINIDKDIIKSYDLYPLDIDGNIVSGVNLSKDKVEVAINANSGKVVPIRIVTMGVVPDGSRVDSIQHSISEIKIVGEESALERISEIQTEPIDLDGITNNITMEVKLIIPEGVSVLTSSGNIVDVTINITKTITRNFNIKVIFEGLKDTLVIKDTEIVSNIALKGYEEILDGLTEENLVVEIDLSSYTEAGEYTIEPQVSIVNTEADISIDSIESVSITLDEFIEDSEDGDLEENPEEDVEGNIEN